MSDDNGFTVTASAHGYRPSDIIRISGMYEPWHERWRHAIVRAWYRWVLRKPPPYMGLNGTYTIAGTQADRFGVAGRDQ